ncbi:hypothetical protein [Mesorhizobium sp. CAU 1732]|uniref:hypothetical protein n=1 Tax=Mesorhizobium sp. CAU 1732 TaxID=3140358 RepID=UPI0032616CE2
MTRLASLMIALILAIASGIPAAMAADPIAVRIDEPGICGNSRVLGQITHRFAHQVRNVPNLPLVDIVNFRQTSESRYQPQGYRQPIERRYCHAKADLSNGHTRDVWYLIERPMGFVGFGSNVEFCVSGFDRWHVYGGRCRVVR